jgi:hypothetical protein
VIVGLLDRLKAFFGLAVPPPALRRIDGSSKALLTASLNMLPDEEPGWITMTEAAPPTDIRANRIAITRGAV